MSSIPTWDGQLPARAELPDGTAIVVRELHPSDEPALRAWFATVSDASRYLRFHSHVSDLSPALWRYLTRIDGVDHIALIALHDGELVGVARMIRLDERTAEIAFLVSDALQRRRVGSLLRDVLIALARARAYRTLFAFVLPQNVAIRKLLPEFVDKGNALELAL
jgi:RimJ/RimL family protein N-acetyltransferase